LTFAERNLLFNDNRVLLDQNNESRTRQSVKNTIVGRAKMMEYAVRTFWQNRRSATKQKPCPEAAEEASAGRRRLYWRSKAAGAHSVRSWSNANVRSKHLG
jgi:hypothetical protein